MTMGMTEHEAILKLKDITQVFQAEDREEVDQMFYNELTLDEIRENLQDFNCVIGEIKQILREVEDGNADYISKADYENRLKADMVALLDRVRVEIEELYSCVEFDEDIKTSFNMIRLEEVQRVIDKYKAESEE